MFRVGQKVAAFRGKHTGRYVVPRIGEPCTVTNAYVTPDNEEMIELAEYPSPENDECYAGFRAICFRPIVERKTDISIFTKMLKPERANA